MIENQNDKFFPSIAKAAELYETKLIYLTNCIKILSYTTNIKKVNFDEMFQSKNNNIKIDLVSKKTGEIPILETFRLQKVDKPETYPIIGFEINENIELFSDSSRHKDFEFDEKPTDNELKTETANNIINKSSDVPDLKRNDNDFSYVEVLSKFYRNNIAILNEVCKAIMLKSGKELISVNFSESAKFYSGSGLHVTFVLNASKKQFKEVKIKISDGLTPTTYGFLNSDMRSVLKIVPRDNEEENESEQ